MTAAIKNNGGSQFDILIGGVVVATIDGTGLKTGAGKRLAQRLRFSTSAVASGSTVIPVDNTIPQITEGDQYMSLTITPTVVGSTIKVSALGRFGVAATGNYVVMSLFMDAVANALDTGLVFYATALGAPATFVTAAAEVVTGSLAPITFRVRAGPSAATTIYLNGSNTGTGLFNGNLFSHLVVEEYLP